MRRTGNSNKAMGVGGGGGGEVWWGMVRSGTRTRRRTRSRRSSCAWRRLAFVVSALVVLLGIAASQSLVASQPSCEKLPASQLNCSFNGSPLSNIDHDCKYGRQINISCTAASNATCQGARTFFTSIPCMYCYQLSQMTCTNSTNCKVFKPDSRYLANCTAPASTLCLGARAFAKNARCNWSSGKVWSTAFLYSVTLGGFGAERFYLGDIGYGIFKLLSFGGFAVWSMVDAILVAAGFLGTNGHWVIG